VGVLGRETPLWVVQPLLDAGLGLEQIGCLVFRLAFEGVVGEGRGPHHLVADRPPEVRAAWARTVGRLLLLEPPG
jgi:hypothetical protein